MIYIPANSNLPEIWLVLGDIPVAARVDVLPAPGQSVADDWNRARLSLPLSATSRRGDTAAVIEAQNFLKDRHGFSHVAVDIRADVQPPPHMVLSSIDGQHHFLYLSSYKPVFTVGIQVLLKGGRPSLEPLPATVAEEHHADFLNERNDYLDLAARKIVQASVMPSGLVDDDMIGYLRNLWTEQPDSIARLWRSS